MAVYRYSAVEKFGVPVDASAPVPLSFALLDGLMRQSHVFPEPIEPAERVEITPAYWLGDYRTPDMEGIEETANPFTNHRFFLTAENAGRAVIDVEPLLDSTVPDVARTNGVSITAISARRQQIFLPDRTSIFMISGPSTEHGSLPCIHELLMAY